MENFVSQKLGISEYSNLQKLIPLIHKLALRPYSVFITGETGTGKEVLAQTLHQLSHHLKTSPAQFVPLNCGAIQANLLEGELFGYQKGAFTGALRDSPGRFIEAHRGTLFLDEIAELPLEAQSKLLRVLQERKVRPLGSQKEIEVDFRLISATHRNLNEWVQEGHFREDLMYRLSVFNLHLLPLRERREDFAMIAQKIWSSLQQPDGKPLPALSLEELNFLKKQPWPGNIRQLKNVLEQFSLFRELGMDIKDLIGEQKHLVKESQKPNFAQVLVDCDNNRSQAARVLGISRGSLNYQLKKQSIS